MLSIDIFLFVTVLSFSFPHCLSESSGRGPYASFFRVLYDIDNMVIGFRFAVVPCVPIAQLRIPIRVRRCDTAVAQHYASCHGGGPALQKCIRGRTRPMNADRKMIIHTYVRTYVHTYIHTHVFGIVLTCAARVCKLAPTLHLDLPGCLCASASANMKFSPPRTLPRTRLRIPPTTTLLPPGAPPGGLPGRVRRRVGGVREAVQGTGRDAGQVPLPVHGRVPPGARGGQRPGGRGPRPNAAPDSPGTRTQTSHEVQEKANLKHGVPPYKQRQASR